MTETKPEQKKLYKNSAEGKIMGVCAGLADYFEVDVTLIRLLVLAIIFFSGIIPGIIFYFIAGIVMPEKGTA